MIYVFLANGFEEVEALTQVDMLRRCELEVRTVGVPSRMVKGAHGITVVCDILPEEMDFNRIDGIVLPGGMPGTLNLEQSKDVQSAIDYCIGNDKIIGAICAAPSILGHRGFLDGKKAVCFPGFENELGDAEYVNLPVVRDGNIITSKGAGTAFQFAFMLAESFTDKAESDHLKAGVQWQD